MARGITLFRSLWTNGADLDSALACGPLLLTRRPRTLQPSGMPPSERAARFSISLPSGLAGQLDRMVRARGFKNRSQAIAEIQNLPGRSFRVE